MSRQNTNIRYNTTQTSNEYLFVVRLHFFPFKTLHPRLQCLVVSNIHSLLRLSFPGTLCDSFLIFALKHTEAVLTSTNNLYFDLKHRLWVHVVPTIYVLEAVLTCTHNLCFRAKMRKK